MEAPGGTRHYSVVVWNFNRDRRSIFKNTADRTEAERLRDSLRHWGLDAEMITVGDESQQPT